MTNPEPIFDIAHLGHIELLTPQLEETRNFFVDVMGMYESGRAGDSIYLRGWDDYEHHSLQLTASPKPGLGHYAFRAMSPQALQRRVEAIEKTGLGKGWKENNVGHGPAYCFTDPDDHNMEIYFETEWYQASAELKPALKNQASKFSDRGVGLRRLDHINILAADVKSTRIFFQETLGARLSEQIIFDDGSEKASWVTFTNKSYDVAIAEDWTGSHGRLHHLTYAVDNREAILRAADICLEHGVFIETGPHKHAINQTFFLYVYEPGGNRFEIANAGARLILAPDWKPIIWTQEERKKGQAWGLPTIPTFHTHGTPPVE
ncbi:MAG TPA: catechol 2,3-dioxygenase [Anaerolineales bacterium]|nr:catechol 2,3-dioxygenase [Anaerolineales bacterium]